MTNNLTENLHRGVEYYNIKTTKREHKENIIEMDLPSFASSSGAIAPADMSSSFSEEGQTEEAKPQVILNAIAYPTPRDLIKSNFVKKSFIQLYKNDDKYKLRVRLNLVIDGEDETADFIAPLTVDRRNFKKYLPEECAEWFTNWSDEWCRNIKDIIGVKAYRGKFHSTQKYKPGVKTLTQIEPWSQCVVWYHPEQKTWNYSLSIYEFEHCGIMSDEGLTIKQKQSNLHRQNIWLNPKYDLRERPKTWAQRRMGFTK